MRCVGAEWRSCRGPGVYEFPGQGAVKRFLREEEIAPQKRWGQNFLIDSGYAERIVALLGCGEGDRIWEIGPGLGALTGLLLNRGCRVTAFEIDWGLMRVLERRFAGDGRFQLHAGDAGREWPAVLAEQGAPTAVIGNLPYRSASSILGSFLERRFVPQRGVFTVQREVADRMRAAPGGKTYSSFSVLCQSIARVDRAFDVPGGAFYPAPEVSSSVVTLDADPSAPGTRTGAEEWELFLRLVRRLFRSRRKIVRTGLQALLRGEEPGAGRAEGPVELLLQACGREATDRPESFHPADFLCLARELQRRRAALRGIQDEAPDGE